MILRNFRQFFLRFPSDEEIRYALRSELTWTHYRLLIRVENPVARAWYMNEAAENVRKSIMFFENLE